MAIVNMNRVSILLMRRDEKAFLRLAQRCGCVHLVQAQQPQAEEAAGRCERIVRAWGAVDAVVRAEWMRRRDPHLRYVPIGGSTPLASVLGGETTVGRGSVIGAGVTLGKSVPPNTVVTIEKPSLRFREAS